MDRQMYTLKYTRMTNSYPNHEHDLSNPLSRFIGCMYYYAFDRSSENENEIDGWEDV